MNVSTLLNIELSEGKSLKSEYRTDADEPQDSDSNKSEPGSVLTKPSGGMSERIQDAEQFQCDCGAQFAQIQDLRRHMRTVHLGRRNHSCRIKGCKASFKWKHGLERHFAAVHLRARPYVCDRCTMAFGEKGNLTKHIQMTHLKVRPYSCPVCKTRFAKRSHVTRHVRALHTNKNTISEGSSSHRKPMEARKSRALQEQELNARDLGQGMTFFAGTESCTIPTPPFRTSLTPPTASSPSLLTEVSGFQEIAISERTNAVETFHQHVRESPPSSQSSRESHGSACQMKSSPIVTRICTASPAAATAALSTLFCPTYSRVNVTCPPPQRREVIPDIDSFLAQCGLLRSATKNPQSLLTRSHGFESKNSSTTASRFCEEVRDGSPTSLLQAISEHTNNCVPSCATLWRSISHMQ